MKLFLVLAAFLALSATTLAKDHAENWAVLVAGSDGWSNYRHQSDIAHAQHILRRAGIPEDHIITIAKDDIANHNRNPFPGQVFNHPNKTHNVYEGHKIDYSGKDATKETLLAVLTGDAEAVNGGPVLRSSKKDNVFFYYSDHGSVNLVAMPVGKPLYAKELQEALEIMHKKEMYNEMVLYVEACESGSMFDQTLPDDMDIYATTAANPHESSYAFYYDSAVGAYLGDEYSISWMEDSDAYDIWKRVMADQTDAVRTRTKGSHVCEYGDAKIAKQVLGEFQAARNKRPGPVSVLSNARPHGPYPINSERVSSRDVTLATLVHQFAKNGLSDVDRAEALAAVQAEVAHRAAADVAFTAMAEELAGPAETTAETLLSDRFPLEDWNCLSNSYDAVEAACGRFSDYSLQYARMLTNTCARGVSAKQTAAAAARACPTAL